MNRLILPDFDFDGISYGFFGRQGGVSSGVYASLNCRNGSEDDPVCVVENRRRVSEALGSEGIVLNNVYQVHGNAVHVIRDGGRSNLLRPRPEADGLVTDRPGVAVGILTADCVPVLFTGVKGDGAPVVAAAHAGWKGALGGILENSVEAMVGLGARLSSIMAAIGPCIAQESYEVDGAFRERFVLHNTNNGGYFVPSVREGHYQFDLPGYCAVCLMGCGVTKIAQSGVDTYSREGEYFSYRRTTHRGEEDYGGQISVIMIE